MGIQDRLKCQPKLEIDHSLIAWKNSSAFITYLMFGWHVVLMTRSSPALVAVAALVPADIGSCPQ